MSTEIKKLGKIVSARYGFGGHDGAMFGVSFVLSTDSWGVDDFWGWWPLTMERSEYARWTDADRSAAHLNVQRKLEQTLHDAKVISVERLPGIPVEITLEDSTLKSWRVLKEVL